MKTKPYFDDGWFAAACSKIRKTSNSHFETNRIKARKNTKLND